MTLPILDASAAGTPEFAAQFRHAFETLGFAYLDNHGIDHALFDEMLACNRAFHELDAHAKHALSLDANHRGYIARNTSTDRLSPLAEVTTPNQSESFLIMREDGPEATAYLAGPNQWPPIDGFRDTMERWDRALNQLCHTLRVAVARALDVPAETFDEAFEEPTMWLRLLMYPATGQPAAADVWGSAPHHDFGFLTLLAQDEVGGLQVQGPSGSWLDVEPRPYSFVMNVGEMLHRYSNGTLKATPHRVVTNTTTDRYSWVYFWDPAVNTVVEPLPSLTDGQPARFEPINFADFLRHQLESTYDQHG